MSEDEDELDGRESWTWMTFVDGWSVRHFHHDVANSWAAFLQRARPQHSFTMTPSAPPGRTPTFQAL